MTAAAFRTAAERARRCARVVELHACACCGATCWTAHATPPAGGLEVLVICTHCAARGAALGCETIGHRLEPVELPVVTPDGVGADARGSGAIVGVLLMSGAVLVTWELGRWLVRWLLGAAH